MDLVFDFAQDGGHRVGRRNGGGGGRPLAAGSGGAREAVRATEAAGHGRGETAGWDGLNGRDAQQAGA
jgi:hypothetical protein